MDPDYIDKLNHANEALLKAIEQQTQQATTDPLDPLTFSFAGIVFLVIMSITFIAGGIWIASQKGRSKLEGGMLAFFFGPFGLFIELLLPNKPAKHMLELREHEVTDFSKDWSQP